MPIDIQPLTPHFGARLSGFRIRDGVDDATFAEIERAADRFGVLVMPDQPLDDAAQIAFSERFGPLEATLAGAVGAGSKIVRVSNLLPDGGVKDPNGPLALFARANLLWHTDSSFKETPAKFSMLSARELPRLGGADTEFASTAAAYDALDDAMRARVEGLIAVHSIAWSRQKISDGATTDEQRKSMPPVRQALVRRNPATGRKSLHLASHVMAIEGMADAEAQALHDELMAIATRPDRVYRHRWRQDDLVLWDNRATVHRATPYDEIGDRRLMIRTTISDFGPTVVDGAIVAAA